MCSPTIEDECMFIKNSISFRFNLVTSLILIALLIAFGSYNQLKTAASLNASLNQKTNEVMARLVQSLPATLWNYETEQLTAIVESEVSAGEIKGVFVFDQDDNLALGRLTEQSGEVVDSELPDITNSTKSGLLSFDDSGTQKEVGRVVLLIDSSLVDEQLESALIRTIAQTIVMVILLVAITYFLLHSMVIRPLKEVGEALKDISHGEGDLTRRLTSTRLDEIGVVANNFNSFADKIQVLVKEVVGSMNHISVLTGELAEVAKSTNNGVQTQNTETEQVAIAVSHMSETSTQTSENSLQASQAANRADQEAVSAKEIVADTIHSMDNLATEIQVSATVINELESDVGSITSMIGVIQSIAEQTNLLALNAAIEAARAGDQGRGFAVVADEVRSLASKTQGTTEEIQDIINKLQSGAQNAVNVITTSMQSGERTVQEINKTSQSLVDIVSFVSTINNTNIKIADASAEQTRVTQEVSQSIHRISDISNNTLLGASNTEDACTRLSALVQQIDQQLQQFKV